MGAFVAMTHGVASPASRQGLARVERRGICSLANTAAPVAFRMLRPPLLLGPGHRRVWQNGGVRRSVVGAFVPLGTTRPPPHWGRRGLWHMGLTVALAALVQGSPPNGPHMRMHRF